MRDRFRKIKIGFALVLLAVLLAGCNPGAKEDVQTRTTLKVMYYSEDGFYYQYGMLFSALYPDIDLKVVSTNNAKPKEGQNINDAILELIKEQKPEVLMLNANQYKKLSNEGRLADLEALAAKDKFDLEGIVPGILEYIRNLSDGKLYGLSPSFYSNAVYYNKDLFTKYGVPFPEDRMSWEQLLQLASRFPTDGEEDRGVYGLKTDYDSGLDGLVRSIGGAMGLSYFNASSLQMTVDSDSWRNVIELANQALRAGYIYERGERNGADLASYEDYLFQDPFINGKVAMSVGGSGLVNQIKGAQDANKERAVRNWDVVTVPVDPKKPNVTNTTSVDQILAIDGQSPNVSAAWKFIRYVNSDEYARVKSKATMGGYPVRTKYIADDEGHNLQAFYALTPVEETVYKDYDKMPNETFGKIMWLISDELAHVSEDKQTVEEAINRIQQEGQQLLSSGGQQ
ncbi:extracellular solute-binding protein [Cohnella terricola]|uniref:Extracellular solute-binding protein n=1 Tax=Cohnella terricola TaxID=1289167 RepID=A0A559JFP4_9BACL|nr:extracellular solute-binding protein [Cohnella terricola]TVX98701.1 extracellular solute-binding protein [Cohnella terricola]